jgi:hypothetical protein
MKVVEGPGIEEKRLILSLSLVEMPSGAGRDVVMFYASIM